MLLFYVRHGDPIYEPDSLTPLGERQAEEVAKRLALYGIDRVFASTSNRAMQTAKPACEMLHKEMELLDFTSEVHAWRELAPDLGDGKKFAGAQPRWKKLFVGPEVTALGRKWYEHPELSAYGFKEAMERVDRESDAWLVSLGYEHDRENGYYRAVRANDDRIALFAHGGFGQAFLSSILDMPYPHFCRHFSLCFTGVTVIEFKGENDCVIPNVLTVSNDAHLYKSGIPAAHGDGLRY